MFAHSDTCSTKKGIAPQMRCYSFFDGRASENARATVVFSPSRLTLLARIRVRIPRPKVGELAHQTQGEGIFAEGETPRPPFNLTQSEKLQKYAL